MLYVNRQCVRPWHALGCFFGLPSAPLLYPSRRTAHWLLHDTLSQLNLYLDVAAADVSQIPAHDRPAVAAPSYDAVGIGTGGGGGGGDRRVRELQDESDAVFVNETEHACKTIAYTMCRPLPQLHCRAHQCIACTVQRPHFGHVSVPYRAHSQRNSRRKNEARVPVRT